MGKIDDLFDGSDAHLLDKAQYEHPPGHPLAVKDGCTCPTMNNANGAGCGYVDAAGNALYAFNLECPLHGGDKAEELDPNATFFDAAEYEKLVSAKE